MRLQPMPLQIDYSNLGSGGGGLSSGVLADQSVVQGVAATPGWITLSAFYTLTAPTAKIAMEAIILVSTIALSGRARIFDTGLDSTGTLVGVPGQVAVTPGTSNLADTRLVTPEFSASLVINRIYQFQVECTGGAAGTDVATLRAARLFKP